MRLWRASQPWVSTRKSPAHREPAVQCSPINIKTTVHRAGKAARDKYHTLIASEENGKVKTLNYAPGPLETEMVEELRAAEHLDPTLKPNFHTKQLDPEASARKLIRLLLGDKFESGAHIDYYDLPDEK